MGSGSRKRAAPRIQKRNKRKDAKDKKKGTSVPLQMHDASQWKSDLTAGQNMKEIGLVINNKPSMRHTEQGKALLGKARVMMNKRHYEKYGYLKADAKDFAEVEAAEEEKLKGTGKDLTEMFPELGKATEKARKPTIRNIKADERVICQRLVKKYGYEAVGKMARDIKINYLQWSRGQVAKHIELYRIWAGETAAVYKKDHVRDLNI